MTDIMDERGGVILDGPFDPDAQATVTDYIDYTEYLPADLIRSLTLIRGLDERYLEATQAVHELTKVYGHLPDLAVDERPNAQDLRSQISQKLDYAVNARESSYAEACRLYDVVDRHFDRLDCIRQKLHALPRPVSDKPSPPAEIAGGKRTRTGKKGEAEGTMTRITLRLDGAGTDATGTPKGRRRRATIAEGRLVRLHPDSPIASTEHSDAEADSKVTRSTTLTDLESDVKAAKTKKEKSAQRPRSSLPASKPNRSVAPMSTSSALALLNPPPENAQPGSADLPWLRLTDWEMTMLRKKMKKNAVWQPSEVMVHRELALSGRGWEAYLAAKAEAEKTGAEFMDCDDVMNTYVPGKLTKRTDGSQGEVLFPTETTLSNRGMKLNEAKKLKRENLAREQAAAAAAEAELAARRLGAVGSAFKSLFSSQGSDSAFATAATRSRTDNIPSGDRSSRKRKLDESSLVDAKVPTMGADVNQLRSSTTKRKSTQGSNTITLTATGAQSGNHRSSRPSPSGAAPTSTRASKRVTGTPTPPIAVTSRRRSGAASVEPVGIAAAVAGRSLRPKSATPARKTPDILHPSSVAGATATGQRRKRPAPGIVQSGLDGGASISHGRRKAKPTKKKVSELRETGSIDGRGTPSQDIRIDEDGVLEEIDPNEPRYCLCGDVSFGTMICCENPDCDKEWFHLTCVGLTEVPSRTAKWYCPDCRPKFSRGADGIVRTGSRR